MNTPIRESTRRGAATIRGAGVVICVCVIAASSPAGIARGEPQQGAVVGWGSQVVGCDLSSGFVAELLSATSR